MTLVIGLTGSIASGKSTVAAMLARENIPVIDADGISRKVVEPGEQAYQKIIEIFGNEIVGGDRSINREKLGQIIFTDEAKRVQLNDIVHPAVRTEMIKQRDHFVKKRYEAVVLDIPLLFESGLTHFVEKTIVVYVDQLTQLNRLMARNHLTEEEALNRIKAQMPVEEKVKLADAVIDNRGNLRETEKQVRQLLKQWGIGTSLQ